MDFVDELFNPAPVAPRPPLARRTARAGRGAPGPVPGFAIAPAIGSLEIEPAIAAGEQGSSEAAGSDAESVGSFEALVLTRVRELVTALDAGGPRAGLDVAFQVQAILEADLVRRTAVVTAAEAQRTVGSPRSCALDDETAVTACGHPLCAFCTLLAGATTIGEAAHVTDAAGLATDHVLDVAGQTIAAEHRFTAAWAKRRTNEALRLGLEFPQVTAAFAAGRISRVHVEQILRRTPTYTVGGDITVEDAAEFARAYDSGAAQLALVTSASHLPAKLTTLANELNPCTLEERHTEAEKHRHVRVDVRDDGMADLVIHLDAVLAKAALNRLTDIARACRKAGAEGSVGSLAADHALTMLLTSAEQAPLIGETGDPNAFTGIASAIKARVAITMPFTSLLAATEDLGDLPELEGKTPLDHATARALLGNADEIVRVVTHPLTGVTITADSYRATPSLRRFLGVRDIRCRWTGCARDGDDIDHTLDYQYGGKTTPENLEVLCKHHHVLKHAVAKTTGERLWKVRHVDADGLGRLEWTTPNGVVLTDDPPRSPGVVFVPTEPDETPPPF